MLYMTSSPLGLFAVDEQNTEVASVFFSKDPRVASRQFTESQKSVLSSEEQELIARLKGAEVIFETKKEAHKHEFPNPAGEYVRSNLFRLASKNGFSAPLFSEFIYLVNFNQTKDLMQSQPVNDRLIIQAVSAIDDLDKAINVMSMRLREWYGLYFPEASERIRDNASMAQYVSETLYRTEIHNIAIEDTIGTDLRPEDLEEYRVFAKSISSLFEDRKSLDKYISKKCREVIPNMAEIIGADQASRILAQAGSLAKLAKFPSSTIQILGAEKALFRFLRENGTSPKHGIIFNTTYIQSASKEHRGKVARILASKLSIACRLDYYKGAFMGDKLKAEMDSAMKEVLKSKIKPRKQFSRPPAKPEVKDTPRHEFQKQDKKKYYYR